jgi:hypothetical protein
VAGVVAKSAPAPRTAHITKRTASDGPFAREGKGIAAYMDELADRSPMKQ